MLPVVALAASWVGVRNSRQRAAADRQRAAAELEHTIDRLLTSDVNLALLLAVESESSLESPSSSLGRLASAVQAATGRQLERHAGPIGDIRFSTDGRFLITGGDDGGIGIWDADIRHGPNTYRELLPNGGERLRLSAPVIAVDRGADVGWGVSLKGRWVASMRSPVIWRTRPNTAECPDRGGPVARCGTLPGRR